MVESPAVGMGLPALGAPSKLADHRTADWPLLHEATADVHRASEAADAGMRRPVSSSLWVAQRNLSVHVSLVLVRMALEWYPA